MVAHAHKQAGHRAGWCPPSASEAEHSPVPRPAPALTRRAFVALGAAAVQGLAACASAADDPGAAEPSATSASGAQPAAAPTSPVADLIITNATIQTMADPTDTAEALAIAAGRIIYVGSTAGAEEYAGPGTLTIDLAGGFVCPGFMDGHMHLPGSLLDERYNCVLTGCASHEDYLAALSAHVANNPNRSAYVATGFMLDLYRADDGSNSGPSCTDLDAICTRKPLVVSDVTRQAVWVNSVVLAQAGITAATPDPAGGQILRNADGTPRGCLLGSAVALVDTQQTFTFDQLTSTLRDAAERCAALGITSVNCIDTLGPSAMRVWHALDAAGELPLRVNVVPTCAGSASLQDTLDLVQSNQRYASERLRCLTVALRADGTVEEGTAYLLEPYAGEAGFAEGWRGQPAWEGRSLSAAVELLSRAGVQAHVHAVGDAAVRQAAEAVRAAGAPQLRHAVVHACAVSERDVQLLADAQVLVVPQFAWMCRDARCEVEAAYLGEDRAEALYPTRDLWDAGVCVCAGSDGPQTSMNPLDHLEVAVTRNSPRAGEQDEDWRRGPRQALTAYEALQAYTSNVAYQLFCEQTLGTLEVGKLADLVCLDTNILTCDPRRISDARVLYTISGGQIVHRA